MSEFNTEDSEMGKVRAIFEHALNAIVQASQLSKDMVALRAEFDSLRSEIDSVRAHNVQLDNELVATREQRDQYARDKYAAIDTVNQLTADLTLERESHKATLESHQTLSEQHQTLKREHDSVQMQALELEEENKALRAQLEKVKAVFGIQPRDVSTGQWQSPTIVDEPKAEEPRTGTDPFWR
mgnify:CR=1 FL=1